MLNVEGLLKETIAAVKNTGDPEEKRKIVLHAVADLPKTPESLPAYNISLKLIKEMEDPDETRAALHGFVKEIPVIDEFTALYTSAVESLIEAVEGIKDHKIKKSSLLRNPHFFV
jgi:hypothetical protein